MQWATRPDRTPGHPATCPNSPTGEHHYGEGNGRPESRTCDHCGAGGCCDCGGGPVAYRNYRGQPFCGPCADGQAPATGSDSENQLHARLTAAIRAIGRGEQEIVELRQRLAETERDRDTTQEGRRLYAAAIAEALGHFTAAQTTRTYTPDTVRIDDDHHVRRAQTGAAINAAFDIPAELRRTGHLDTERPDTARTPDPTR